MLRPESELSFREDAMEWCRGRYWIWRAPLLAYLAYAGVQHMRFIYYSSLFGGITFGIHELGHVIFSFLGQFIGVAGGSLAQLLAPLAAGAILLRQRDYYGVSVAGSWLSFSLYNLATYIADARAQELPLLGLTDDPIHDWHYLLTQTGLLNYDTILAFLTRCLGFAVLTASLALGAWLCWVMARPRPVAGEGRGPSPLPYR